MTYIYTSFIWQTTYLRSVYRYRPGVEERRSENSKNAQEIPGMFVDAYGKTNDLERDGKMAVRFVMLSLMYVSCRAPGATPAFAGRSS